MSALLNCLPAAQRARARLRMELDRMQARARRLGWSKIALIASLAIMVILAVASALIRRSQVQSPGGSTMQGTALCMQSSSRARSRMSTPSHVCLACPSCRKAARCTSVGHQKVYRIFASTAGGFCRLW